MLGFLQKTGDQSDDIGPGHSIAPPKQRPNGLHQHDIGDENVVTALKDRTRVFSLRIVVAQQISQQDICIGGDHNEFARFSATASWRDCSSETVSSASR